jgi:hypothetical protein
MRPLGGPPGPRRRGGAALLLLLLAASVRLYGAPLENGASTCRENVGFVTVKATGYNQDGMVVLALEPQRNG